MTPPLCSCHGEPMYVMTHRRGYPQYGCRVKKRARDSAYIRTDKGRARARRFRLAERTHARERRITQLEELRHSQVQREDRS